MRRLVARGVPSTRIHVQEARVERGRLVIAREGRGPVVGMVLGAAIAATLVVLFWGPFSADVRLPFVGFVAQVLGAAIAGALVGSVVGSFATGEHARRDPRHGPAAAVDPSRAFVVRVRTEDPGSAASVTNALRRSGGAPVGA